MNNNKTTNILLGILIVVLIAIGIIMAINQNRNSYRGDVIRNEDSVVDSRNDISTSVKSNSTATQQKSINWKTVTSANVLDIYKKAGFFVGSGTQPTLLKEVDLTGDEINEAIYSGELGNASNSALLMADSDGSILVAKTKNKDGKIENVEFWEAGMASHTMGYKLIPNERGYYTISFVLDESVDNSENSHFVCSKNDGVVAFQWNPKTNLFEYNTALTAKYTAIECK